MSLIHTSCAINGEHVFIHHADDGNKAASFPCVCHSNHDGEVPGTIERVSRASTTSAANFGDARLCTKCGTDVMIYNRHTFRQSGVTPDAYAIGWRCVNDNCDHFDARERQSA
jgi:hypothetical protein